MLAGQKVGVVAIGGARMRDSLGRSHSNPQSEQHTATPTAEPVTWAVNISFSARTKCDTRRFTPQRLHVRKRRARVEILLSSVTTRKRNDGHSTTRFGRPRMGGGAVSPSGIP